MIKKTIFILRYVDYGNEELVPEHRLRRLLDDFHDLPAMATSVYLAVKVSTSAESVLVGAELRNTVLYHEHRMKVRDVSSHGKLTVELLTLPDLTPDTEFIEALKKDQH